MFKIISAYLNGFLQLFYPHNCESCGTDVLSGDTLLCTKCIQQLPVTGFLNIAGNPIERIFYGRLDLLHAGALYYFTKESLLQHLLIQLKYKGNKESGYFLGRMMGRALADTERFKSVDILVPLPLNLKRAHQRGYNQSELICEGISQTWEKPIINNAIIRTRFTETQTRQDRVSRWQNMEKVFAIADEAPLKHKHILLVDDVVTTGASLEACGATLAAIEGVRLSIITIAYTI